MEREVPETLPLPVPLEHVGAEGERELLPE